MNKWSKWYESLPEHTRQYLDTRPVWHDRDLLWFGLFTFVAGVFIGKAM